MSNIARSSLVAGASGLSTRLSLASKHAGGARSLRNEIPKSISWPKRVGNTTTAATRVVPESADVNRINNNHGSNFDSDKGTHVPMTVAHTERPNQMSGASINAHTVASQQDRVQAAQTPSTHRTLNVEKTESSSTDGHHALSSIQSQSRPRAWADENSNHNKDAHPFSVNEQPSTDAREYRIRNSFGGVIDHKHEKIDQDDHLHGEMHSSGQDLSSSTSAVQDKDRHLGPGRGYMPFYLPPVPEATAVAPSTEHQPNDKEASTSWNKTLLNQASLIQKQTNGSLVGGNVFGAATGQTLDAVKVCIMCLHEVVFLFKKI